MRAKEYLSQLFWIDDEIKTLAMEREELFSSTFKHPVWSDMKVQSSQTRTLEDTYVVLAEYAKRIEVKSSELLSLKIKISEQIDNVEDSQSRRLLRLRYVMGLKWEQVAEHMMLDLRWVHRLHGKALKEFDKILTMLSH